MKELSKELQAELAAKDRLGKLANNPNITGFTPQGGKEVLKNIPMIGKSKSKSKSSDKTKEVKSENNRLTTVLTGERARQLDTSEKVLAYLESKKTSLFEQILSTGDYSIEFEVRIEEGGETFITKPELSTKAMFWSAFQELAWSGEKIVQVNNKKR